MANPKPDAIIETPDALLNRARAYVKDHILGKSGSVLVHEKKMDDETIANHLVCFACDERLRVIREVNKEFTEYWTKRANRA